MTNVELRGSAPEVATQLQQMVARGDLDRSCVTTLASQLGALAMRQTMLVFAIPGYERLAQEIVAASNGWLELAVDERKRHADGKGWQRFVTPVRGREVLLVGGTMTDTDQMELYKLGCNAWNWKAHKVTFLIPYHGDARQERAQSEGESVDGLYASMMLAKIPSCPGGNDVFLVDIHADAVTGFFLGAGMRCVNIEVLNQLIASIAAERYGGKCMLAAPDAGRGKVVSKTAKSLGLRFAIASKSRPKKPGSKPETAGLIGHVRGRNVILSDDMGVSFSSAIGAGEFIRQKGARDVVLAITHGVIPDEKYMQTLIDTKIFSCLYVTDSMPRVYTLKEKFPDFIIIVPLAPLVVPQLLG